ncbi:gamma-glutamylcyclotransferase family protein [Pararobbsia silviterrae]|uniref:Gamma-glutamylcyclotransferase family protein n=1 Tax=Pararobbsia silviterrae TaxID=1792498 RepID=A0A494XWE3_9BURK|nr:gamma-glutamylcyclotransferase family protein [Pararobbsia silviterrae]RKP54878.1 gamma-glutamylcyclotransferase [Pararobbsia silviterrae]
MLTIYVFVYGTLRAGESNDVARAAEARAIAQPRLIGEATLRGHLYDFGAYPGLVRDDTAQPVRGEVYEMVQALLPVLDEIEEVYPGEVGLFVREVCEIEVDGRRLSCFYYPIHADRATGLPRIESGDWVDHDRVRRERSTQ